MAAPSSPSSDKISDYIPNPTFGKVAVPGGAGLRRHEGRRAASATPASGPREDGGDAEHRRVLRPRAPPRAHEGDGHRPHAPVADARERARGAHGRRPRRGVRGHPRAERVDARALELRVLRRHLLARRSSRSRSCERRHSRSSSTSTSAARKIFLIRVAPVPTWKGRKSFALPEFDPFWERVQELDLVVGMHSGDSGYTRYTNEWEGLGDNEMSDRGQRHAAVEPGLPDPVVGEGQPRRRDGVDHRSRARHPLPEAPVHAGGVRQPVDPPLLPRSCSAPTTRRRSSSTRTRSRCSTATCGCTRSTSPTRRGSSTSGIPVDHIMFGSDFPHPEGMERPAGLLGGGQGPPARAAGPGHGRFAEQGHEGRRVRLSGPMTDDDEFVDAVPADYLEPGETTTVDVDGVPVTVANAAAHGARSRASARTRRRHWVGSRSPGTCCCGAPSTARCST